MLTTSVCLFFSLVFLSKRKQVLFNDLNHRITQSLNGRGWKGPLWVV